ncbi:MAG: prolyl aminopeptidase [Vicinamibacterales bacterium]
MWYPAIEPFRHGILAVDHGHQLYWEMCGNPQGTSALVVHGGPGGGCSPNSRRWFDPARYCAVLFDQRGCGRSEPRASLDHNTTNDLIADIETLRVELAIEQWVVLGRSWGAALAIAYAERHPERVAAMVLNAVFTARCSELEWLYQGGAANIYPEAWSRFVAPIDPRKREDLIKAYHARVTCGDLGEELAAARDWCGWEHAIRSSLPGAPGGDDRTLRARARIETHYFVHRAFLAEGQLLEAAHRLAPIPGVIVQGRCDVVTPPTTAWDLHRVWPTSRLQLVPHAGHDACEPDVMRALIEATDSVGQTESRSRAKWSINVAADFC